MTNGQILGEVLVGTLTPSEAARLMQENDDRARAALWPRWVPAWFRRAVRWAFTP